MAFVAIDCTDSFATTALYVHLGYGVEQSILDLRHFDRAATAAVEAEWRRRGLRSVAPRALLAQRVSYDSRSLRVLRPLKQPPGRFKFYQGDF